MWIALPLARSLAGRFIRAAAATALAVSALVTVAALVEGHPPRMETLRAVVAPLAGAWGACWALGGWRRAGADIACGALGWRAGAVAIGLLLLASPLVALGPQPTVERTAPIAVDTDRIVAHLPDGAVEWRWTADGLQRTAGGQVEPMATIPRPTPGPQPPADASPTLAFALRLAMLALVLGWLSHGAVPGPSRVVIGATLAFIGGHGGAWLLA